MFQSTHPRRVRRSKASSMEPKVSFNPRTHVGCDRSAILTTFSNFCFNPRTHVGCDMWHVTEGLPCTCFNPRTHVGCDCNELGLNANYNMFQSTHPRRVRLPLHSLSALICRFQSTHPRRVRPRPRPYRQRSTCFNPRTHVGCDRAHGHTDSVPRVSIHAPT